MPGDIQFHSKDSYFGMNLTKVIAEGEVSEAQVREMMTPDVKKTFFLMRILGLLIQINDMATRILAAWYMAGQDQVSTDSFMNVQSARCRSQIVANTEVSRITQKQTLIAGIWSLRSMLMCSRRMLRLFAMLVPPPSSC